MTCGPGLAGPAVSPPPRARGRDQAREPRQQPSPVLLLLLLPPPRPRECSRPAALCDRQQRAMIE